MDFLKSNICYFCDRQFESASITANENRSLRIVCKRSFTSKCILCSDTQNEVNIYKPRDSIPKEYNAEKACADLESNLNIVENLSKNPVNFIYDYFTNLINKIDLRREELKVEVEKKYVEILEYVNEYRTECEAFATSKENQETKFVHENLKKWRSILEIPDLDELNSNFITKEAIQVNLMVKRETDKLKNTILQSKKLDFDSTTSSYDLVSSIFKIKSLDNK